MLKPRSSEIHRWARKLIVTFPRCYSEKLFSGLLTYSRVLWITLLTYSRESRIFVLTYSRVFTRKAASVLDPSFLEYNVTWNIYKRLEYGGKNVFKNFTTTNRPCYTNPS